ncbi:nucleotide exchange factor GrpE [Candidatus Dojkabacteria bacterium]|nr:nucleotide exchange factor GrpE [Candidatus Dojkabacteria bacterium]
MSKKQKEKSNKKEQKKSVKKDKDQKDVSKKVDNKNLEEKIKDLEERLQEEKESRLVALADFENYKKRVQAEKEQLNLLANATVLNLVLEVLDDLQRAMQDMEEVPAGLSMIEGKITNLLEEQGLEQINVEEGDEFDPKLMEALGTVTVEDKEKDGKVIHLERKGYKFKDKDIIVRGARVIVGKKETKS